MHWRAYFVAAGLWLAALFFLGFIDARNADDALMMVLFGVLSQLSLCLAIFLLLSRRS